MEVREKFINAIKSSYTFKGESILIGSAILGEDQETGCQITVPLKTMNRHGLIAGAAGTGKTKSLAGDSRKFVTIGCSCSADGRKR